MDNREPPMLVQHRTLAYTALPTYEEFLHHLSSLSTRLRQRASEVRLTSDDQSELSSYPDFIHFVAFIDEETPDSWIVPPIWSRIAQVSPRFSLRVATEQNDLEPLAQLLGEDDMISWLEEQELPLLLILDEELTLQAQWGPHPRSLDPLLDRWLADHPQYEALTESDDPVDIAAYAVLADQLAGEMRVWYNDSLNHACVAELRSLLIGLIDENGASDEEDITTDISEEEAS